MPPLAPDKDPRTVADLAAVLGRFPKGRLGVEPTPPTPEQLRETGRQLECRLARYQTTGDPADLSRPIPKA